MPFTTLSILLAIAAALILLQAWALYCNNRLRAGIKLAADDLRATRAEAQRSKSQEAKLAGDLAELQVTAKRIARARDDADARCADLGRRLVQSQKERDEARHEGTELRRTLRKLVGTPPAQGKVPSGKKDRIQAAEE